MARSAAPRFAFEDAVGVEAWLSMAGNLTTDEFVTTVGGFGEGLAGAGHPPDAVVGIAFSLGAEWGRQFYGPRAVALMLGDDTAYDAVAFEAEVESVKDDIRDGSEWVTRVGIDPGDRAAWIWFVEVVAESDPSPRGLAILGFQYGADWGRFRCTAKHLGTE